MSIDAAASPDQIFACERWPLKLALIAALTTLADWLFFRREIGISLAVFVMALGAAVLMASPTWPHRREIFAATAILIASHRAWRELRSPNASAHPARHPGSALSPQYAGLAGVEFPRMAAQALSGGHSAPRDQACRLAVRHGSRGERRVGRFPPRRPGNSCRR
jgi:hypothetical protein